MRDYMLASQLDASAIAPDLRAPVHGFRAWRVSDEQLRSRASGTTWARREMRALCQPRAAEQLLLGAHEAPAVHCSCGLAAFFEPPADVVAVDAGAVVGIVRAWGAMVVERDGFRAQVMEMVALGIDDRWTKRQRDAVIGVASSLKADLVAAADLADAAALYAAAVPATVRPGSAVRGRRRSAPPVPRELVVAGPEVSVPANDRGRFGGPS